MRVPIKSFYESCLFTKICNLAKIGFCPRRKQDVKLSSKRVKSNTFEGNQIEKASEENNCGCLLRELTYTYSLYLCVYIYISSTFLNPVHICTIFNTPNSHLIVGLQSIFDLTAAIYSH